MKKLLLFSFLFISIHISKSQNFDWGKNIGGVSAYTYAYSIITDSSDNIYTYGIYRGTTDFDPGPDVYSLTSLPHGNLFVEKLDSNGNFIWVKDFTKGNSLTHVEDFSIKLDAANNIYLSGTFSDTVDFDPGPGTHIVVAHSSSIEGSENESFILKLDSSGDFIWVTTNKTTDVTSRCISFSLCIDKAGFIYQTGMYTGTAVFGSGISSDSLFSDSGSSESTFIQKLDSLGNLVWVKRFSGSRGINCIADDSLNVYVEGRFYSTTDFDPGSAIYNLTNPDSSISLFITKLDFAGNFKWAISIPIRLPPMVEVSNILHGGLALDATEKINIIGLFNNTIDCDPGPSVFNLSSLSTTTSDMFIIKLNSSGNFINAKKIDVTGYIYSSSIQKDELNNIYINGCFSGTVDMDPDLSVSNCMSGFGSNIFIAKLNSSYNLVWVKSFGNEYSCQTNGRVFLDRYNNVYGVGKFRSVLDINPGTDTLNITSVSTGTSNCDSYIFKWNQDSCSNFLISVDDVKDITCETEGSVLVHGRGGIGPYVYGWSVTPAVADSLINNITASGIYTVTSTDSIGCVKSASALVNGPFFDMSDMTSYSWNSTVRSGMPASFPLVLKNKSCVPASGNVKLILDTAATYVSSTIDPISISADTLTWNFSDFNYDSLSYISINLLVSPYVTLGDSLFFKTIVSTDGLDADTSNNIKNYTWLIVNAYDPNEKAVYPAGKCTPGYISGNELLTYTVRFQNTGTTYANNIYLLDTLDTDLDLNSIRVIGSSHPVITEVKPGHLLKFRFDDIHLLDSTTSEPLSHGYIIFEAKPLHELASGTEIKNKVGIYFDFNEPVYTNTVLNTITDALVNTSVSGSNTITSNLSGAMYQWIDCNHGDTIIVDANDQSFTPFSNGSYAVIVSDGCFSDTSACVAISTVGIHEQNSFASFSVYPNPTQNTITVNTTNPTELYIINIVGEEVLKVKAKNKTVIDVSVLNKGIYFIRHTNGETIKLIRQ